MRKTEPKIKYGMIPMEDKVNAIEQLANSYFTKITDGDGNISLKYTPYLSEYAKVVIVASYFIDGIKFDEGENIFDAVLNDSEVSELVEKFLSEASTARWDSQREFVQILEYADDIVEYRKSENVARLQSQLNAPLIGKLLELTEAQTDKTILEKKAVKNFDSFVSEQRELNSLITPQMQKEFVEKFDAAPMIDVMMEKFADSGLYNKNREIRELNRKLKEAGNLKNN